MTISVSTDRWRREQCTDHVTGYYIINCHGLRQHQYLRKHNNNGLFR